MVKKKRIATTLIAGSIAELVNKLFPLVIIHYAQTKLGMESFGYAQFGMLLVDLTIPFVVYGYQNYTSIEIGRNKDNKDYISKLLSNVIFIRLIHAGIAAFFLGLLVAQSSKYQDYLAVVLATSFVLFTSAIDLLPLMVGIQKLKSFSFFTIISKSISLALILSFVNDPNDTIIYAVITQATNSAISLATFIYGMRFFKIHLPDKKMLLSTIKDSTPFAVMILLIYPFERFDLIIIEHFGKAEAAGLYFGAWRLMQSLTQAVLMIGNVFVSELVSIEDQHSFTKHIKLAVWIIMSLVVTAGLGSWFIDSQLISLVLGEDFSAAGPTLSMLLTSSIFFALFNLFGMQILMLKNSIWKVNQALFIGLVVGSIVSYSLAPNYSFLGVSFGSIVAKFCAALYVIYYAHPHISEFPTKEILKGAFPALVMFVVLYFLDLNNLWVNLIVGGSVIITMTMIINRNHIFYLMKTLKDRKSL